VAESFAADALDGLELLCHLYGNNRLPSWAYDVLLAAIGVPIVKSQAAAAGDVPDLRPVCLTECFRRLFERAIHNHHRSALADAFEPVHLGGRRGGAEIATHGMRVACDEAAEAAILFAVDQENAYGSFSRAAGLEAVCESEHVAHMLPYFYAVFSRTSSVSYGDGFVLEVEEGGNQGACSTGDMYQMATLAPLKQLRAALQRGGPSEVVSQVDDTFGITEASPETFWSALHAYSERLLRDCGIRLSFGKCVAGFLNGEQLQRPPWAAEVGDIADGDGHRGLVVLKSPVGTEAFRLSYLRAKGERIVARIEELRDSFVRVGGCEHVLFRLAAASLQHAAVHWLRTNLPADLADSFLPAVSKALLSCLEVACGGVSLTTGDQLGLAEQRLFLPAESAARGCGFLSLSSLAPVAFIAGLGTAFRAFFDGDDGAGRDIEALFNDFAVRAFGTRDESLEADEPFRRFTQRAASSPTATSTNYVSAWRDAQAVAAPGSDVATAFLQGSTEEGPPLIPKLQSILAAEVTAGRVAAIVEVLDAQSETRQAVLIRGINELSFAFLTAPLLGPYRLSGGQLATALAVYLQLPLPIIGRSGAVGGVLAPSGRQHAPRVVDAYGDVLFNTEMPGVVSKLVHDGASKAIASLLRLAGIDGVREAFTVFSDLLPAPGAPGNETGRLNVAIPDFLLHLPAAGGAGAPQQPVLAELKTKSYGPTWYRPRDDPAGEEAASCSYWGRSELSARRDLHTALADGDVAYHSTARDAIGPLRRRLGDYPPLLVLTVGAVCEASPTLLELVDTMAVSYAQKVGLEDGSPLARRRQAEFRQRALWCINITVIRMRHLVLSGRVALVTGARELVASLDEAVVSVMATSGSAATDARREEMAQLHEETADGAL
jgi:hypothetical protein